jgi:hypothetical protein
MPLSQSAGACVYRDASRFAISEDGILGFKVPLRLLLLVTIGIVLTHSAVMIVNSTGDCFLMSVTAKGHRVLNRYDLVCFGETRGELRCSPSKSASHRSLSWRSHRTQQIRAKMPRLCQSDKVVVKP